MRLPKEITKERLGVLIPKLKNQTITLEERNEIVLGFLRLALKIVRTVSKGYQNDDLIGFAYLTLIVEIDKAGSKLKDDDLANFLAYRLIRRCLDAKNSDVVVGPTARQKRYYKEKKLEQLPLLESLDGLSAVHHHDCYLDDLLSGLTISPIEREILRLRVLGYTDEEIGSMFQWSQQNVNLRRLNIARRLETTECRKELLKT